MAALAAIAVLAVTLACRSEQAAVPEGWAAEVESWSQDRLERLTRDDGWLTLVGLHWLTEGANRFGSAETNDLAFPAGAPAEMGIFHLENGELALEPAPGVVITADGQPVEGRIALASDADGAPTRLEHGSLTFYVIHRGDRHGVRVKDSQSPIRTGFLGIDRFPLDPAWHLEARYEPYEPPKEIQVPDVLGQVNVELSPGAAVFELGGGSYRLDLLPGPDETEVFVLFGDGTNGEESYGGGRFLYARAPEAGRLILDFNRAYNPPCAFTDYATCPLPPPQNKLAVAIEAGEKKYAGSRH